MKYLINNFGGIERFTDEEAAERMRTEVGSWMYVTRQEWKAKNREGLSKQDVSRLRAKSQGRALFQQ